MSHGVGTEAALPRDIKIQKAHSRTHKTSYTNTCRVYNITCHERHYYKGRRDIITPSDSSLPVSGMLVDVGARSTGNTQ